MNRTIAMPTSVQIYFVYCLLTFIGLFAISSQLAAQQLKPGFDKQEFMEVLRINARFSETSEKAKLIPQPEDSRLLYRSPVIGLANLWQLWLTDERTAVLNTRGTTGESISWMANLYAAQVPAKGSLHIDTNFIFDYDLADHPQAAVHVGYLLSAAFLARDMLPKIDSCYKAGIRDFIVAGHSQGGGISYMLGAHFLNLQRNGILPADIRLKIYTSASPKPGNLYFAYDFEHQTAAGWHFNITNTEDWVPQTPFTVQTEADLPVVNPAPMLENTIRKQSFFKRLVFKTVYRKATKPSKKAVQRYHKYLGKFTAKNIKKQFPNFIEPPYATGNDYVRAGAQVVLYPDRSYMEKFKVPENNKDMMFHHSLPPYYYLLERYKW